MPSATMSPRKTGTMTSSTDSIVVPAGGCTEPGSTSNAIVESVASPLIDQTGPPGSSWPVMRARSPVTFI